MKRTISTVDVVGQWCVPGRTDPVVLSDDPSTWIVLHENEKDAMIASVEAAQAGRLRPWMAYGMSAPADVLKASMEVDGVMLRCKGALTLVPARFGERWISASRQGTEDVLAEAMLEIVYVSSEDRRSLKRFAKRVRRVLRDVNGVWDAEAGIMVLFDTAGLQFSRPESVKKLSTKDRIAERPAGAMMSHTQIVSR